MKIYYSMKQLILMLSFLISSCNLTAQRSEKNIRAITDFFSTINIDSIIKSGLCGYNCNIFIYHKTANLDTSIYSCLNKTIVKQSKFNRIDFLNQNKNSYKQIVLDKKILVHSSMKIATIDTLQNTDNMYLITITTPIFSRDYKFCLFSWKYNNSVSATLLFERRKNKWYNVLLCESYK